MESDDLLKEEPKFYAGYRKHSSGDLHSRLKTRKLLGVGETDDGDVHRSKLSQILGHSDQLYVRLPWGLRIWQGVLAVVFTVVALWALIFPAHLYEVLFSTHNLDDSLLPIRLYGIAILCISLVYWSTLQSADREIIRMILLVSMVYFGLQTFMIVGGALSLGRSECFLTVFLGSVTLSGVSGVYYWAIGGKLISIRRSTSNKDLSGQASPQPVAKEVTGEKEHIN